MLNPFRMSAKNDDDIDPLPPSYFLINKYALGVAVVFFIIGFYCAHHYYNPDPPDEALPEQTSDSIKELMKLPCTDIVVRADNKTRHRCSDPRARVDVKSEYHDHGATFIVCSCH